MHLQPRMHAEKIPQRKARNHGRRTSTRPGNRRPFIGCPSGILRLRARAQRRRLLGGGERSFFLEKKKQTRILQIMAGIISSSSSSSCCGRRSLLRGVGQRDAFISYLFGLERFTSAAALPPLHAFRPRCGDAPPCGAETEPTASCSQHHIHDISAGSELFSKKFFLKPGLVVGVHIDRAQRQNN